MRKTLSLIAIYMLLTMGAIAQRPINGLAHRILGEMDTWFVSWPNRKGGICITSEFYASLTNKITIKYTNL